MKILLTGVAGFLGSHLTQKLISEGHQVIGLDNFSSGSKKNISDFINNPSFTFQEQDVCQPFFCEVDAILNFACPASPPIYQLDPVRTIETNFVGTLNLLKLAKQIGAIFIQASTSEVYGDPTQTPQNEKYWGNVNPVGIRSCYDEGKRAAETLSFDFKRQFGLDARVIRIFNTYGPNMAINDGRVVSNLIVQALKGVPMTIFGDGKQTRSFCYVSDLVEAIYLTLLCKNRLDSPINLGNPTEFSMNILAKKIKELTNTNSKLVYMPLPGDDPKQRKPDISLAKKLLGWEPAIDLNSGLIKTVDYFTKELASD
jgi:UDP-glucuronate decarboxylase